MITPKFFNGRLNFDDSKHVVPPGDYIDALNVTSDQIAGQHDLVKSNIKSNRFIPFNYPAGSNMCIGAYGDELRNKVYWFQYNSDGYNAVMQYDRSTNTITTILESRTDTDNADLLNFNVNYKISHVNVLHRPDNEGDLLFWTDNYNPPRKINIQRMLDGTYGVVEEDFINVIKRPPLVVATVAYGSDATKTTNSLRKALYKFKYRWVYDDFEKSTWGIISAVPLPIDADNSDVAVDSTQNNFISVQVQTGNKDVVAIEIAAQSNIDNLWSDFFLAISLDKSESVIADNATYQFDFYNDGVYPALDVNDSTLLFSWVPQLAKAQTMPNGNHLLYGAITEGYDPIPLQVDMTVTNIKNTGEDLGDPDIDFSDNGSTGTNWTFTVNGDVPVGTFYRIVMNITGIGVIVMTSYTSIGGDTIVNVAGSLYANTSPTYQASYGGTNSFILNTPMFSSVVQIQIIPGSGGGITTINSPTTWNWNSHYRFGLVYFDDYGRTNGVMYYGNFDVTTDNMSVDGGVPETPVISASIFHIPPTWATKYIWARTNNLTYQTFLYYNTCDFQDDSTNGYYYFCLQNIKYYHDLNTTFIYDEITVLPGDRIKILCNNNGTTYTSTIHTEDYEILGLEERQLTGGASSDVGMFIKTIRPTSNPGSGYSPVMLVMVYTPAKNVTDDANTVFYEFGDTYNIYDGYNLQYSAGIGAFIEGENVTGLTSFAVGELVSDDAGVSMTLKNVIGTFVVGELITGDTSGATWTLDAITGPSRYHEGLDQDQGFSQPATFTFTGGDIYYRARQMYYNIVVGTEAKGTLNIMDANYSDFFLSAVNGNGRPEIIDVNAKQQFQPVLVRYSQAYVNNSSINGLNIFFFENFDEYNRDYGDIQKLDTYGSYMKVGQKFRIGNVPVLQQMIRDQNQQSLLATSDQLINTIYYYDGQFGIGESPESWARNNFAAYFCDTNRGIICRLSQDGITPLSILYKTDSWAKVELPQRTGNYKIFGVFNSQVNRYEFAMQATPISAAYTMAFDEPNNAFEGERSYQPDWLACLGTLLVTWKNGQLHTHDGATYNNFYGQQYESSITGVFNESPLQKKTFLSITEVASDVWDCPEITTNINAIQPLAITQQSNLISQDFFLIEGNYNATLLRDVNSPGGLIEGDSLKGVYMTMKFRSQNFQTSKLVYLSMTNLLWIDSPMNVK